MNTDDEKKSMDNDDCYDILCAVGVGIFSASVAWCGWCILYPDDLPSSWVCVVAPLVAVFVGYLVMRRRPRS